jgi:hypothetical protein
VESVQSDAEGHFVLDGLEAGKYPLTASKRGFRTSFYDEHDEYNSAIVTGAGQDTTNLVFRLTPNAVLYGVVTGDGGDPVEGASVLLFERSHGTAADVGQNGHDQSGSGSSHSGSGSGQNSQKELDNQEEQANELDATTTDDEGGYEFANLAAGEYLIAVSASPWYAMHGRTAAQSAGGEANQLDVAYAVTFYDSTTEEASATPVALPEGGRQEADIALHAVPALRLQVAVPHRGAGGIARPELRKMVLGVQVSAESSGFLDALQSGGTEFGGLAPGRYQLTQGDPPRIVDLDLTASEDVEGNSGVPAVSVHGLLVGANGAAVPEMAIVTLAPAGDPRGRATVQAPAHNGQFSFEAVEAGAWSLSASTTSQTLPVIAVSGAGRASATGGSQIVVKDQPVTVTATVSLSLATVQGFARRDGKGVSGAMIVLVPKQPSAYRALVRRDQSDSDGSFALRDVPGGRYTVVAIEDGWKLDWKDRENMTKYLPAGTEVTVPDRTGAGTVIVMPGAVPVQAR